jgi:hypothetical protein
VVVLLHRVRCLFKLVSATAGEFGSDAAKTCFAALNLSQLFEKLFSICTLVPGFWCAVL